ncbi:hypothetical protein SAMN04488128_102560 [Chitinophaga eiseniae]|uniref:Uncharacterized protein n=1 Tax=Chitinophaga eiseniae TaxID=634771 RepID=A0A1T4QS13_9BACT|nr:hypothetical protein SAMN04488128_102560 [Chitinophaga eiseniae]
MLLLNAIDCTVKILQKMYLKPKIFIDPLVDSWYAWSQL